MPTRDLKVNILGNDLSAKAFLRAGKNADTLGGKFAAFGKVAAVGALAAGAAVGAFAANGIKDAAALDGKLREVNTLFGATGKVGEQNFADISKAVKDVSSSVGIAQSTVAEGLYSAISAGVPKANVFDFMQVASKASIAGVTDVNTAVDGITSTINAFGLKAEDAQRVSDSMFQAVKGGKTTFGELAASMSNIAPSAAAANVSMEEVNAAIATMTFSGVPTAQATTQIRAALGGLQKPSKELDKIFQALGFTNAQAAIKAKGMGFALGAVKDAAKGNNGTLQQLLGSTEAVSAANILAGTGAEKFASEMKAQQSAAGSTQTAFEEMNKSVGRQWEQLKVAVQNLGIEVGQKVLPSIIKALEGLSAWWAANGSAIVASASAMAIGIAAAFWPISTAIGLISRNFDTIKTATLIAAAVMSPVLIVLGAQFAALGVAAVVSAEKQVWSWIQSGGAAVKAAAQMWLASVRMIGQWVASGAAAVASAAKQVWSWATTAARAVAGGVAAAAAAARVVAGWVLMGVQSLIQAARMAAAWFIALGPIGWVTVAVIAIVALIIANWSKVVTWTKAAWSAVTAAVIGAWNAVKGATSAAVAWMKGTVSAAWNWVKAATVGAWNAIKGATVGAWNAVKGAVSAALGAIKGAVSAAWNSVRAATAGAWNAIKAAVSGAWNAIKSVITSALGAVKSVITSYLNAYRAVFSAGWNAIKSVTSAAWAAIKSVISAVLSAVKSVITSVLGAVRSIFSAAWNAIKSATSGAWNAIKSVITAVLGAVKSAISSYSNAYRAAFSATWNAIKSVVSAGVSNLLGNIQRLGSIASTIGGFFGRAKDAAVSALGSLVSTVAGIPGRVLSALGNMGSLLLSAGLNLISGFVRGIRSGAGSIVSAIRSAITDKLPWYVKKALGIDSPSKVFAALGLNVSEGMAQGIAGGARDVKRAATDMADLAGMDVAGTGYVMGRLTRTAAQAQPAGAAQARAAAADKRTEDDAQQRHEETLAALDAVRQALEDLPRGYRLAIRAGAEDR